MLGVGLRLLWCFGAAVAGLRLLGLCGVLPAVVLLVCVPAVLLLLLLVVRLSVLRCWLPSGWGVSSDVGFLLLSGFGLRLPAVCWWCNFLRLSGVRWLWLAVFGCWWCWWWVLCLDRLRLAVLRCCPAVAVPAVLAGGGGASVLLLSLAVVPDFQEKGSNKSIFAKIENKKAKLF